MNDFVGYIDSEGRVFDGTFDYEGRVGPIGPQGVPGYTPQRGIDYWTDEDKAYVVAEATSLINGKIEEYNENAATKTQAFNDNATSKTNTFNSNASDKTTAFNSNATSKTTDYNTNASDKLAAYNSNATSKTGDFNDNATAKTTAFDAHVDSEFDELTGNFYTKSQTYSKDEVDGKVASAYHYKGSVTDYTELPSSGQQVGDVWNIEQAGGGYNAGDNVGWTGTGWDVLAGTVDLSNYYNKTEADTLLAAKQNVLTPGSGISITSDTIKVDGEVIEVEEDVAVKNLNTGIYRIKGGHTISYTDVGGAEPLQYAHSVYMVVEEITASKSYFYILRGNTSTASPTMIIDYGYTYKIISSWTGGVSSLDAKDLVDKDYLATKLAEKQAEIDQLYDQIPTATATGDNINIQDSSNLPIQEFDMLGNATQADTPTPDTPQDIHVVTGDNTVKVLGENIIDEATLFNGYLNNGVYEFTSPEVRSGTLTSRFAKIKYFKENTQYVLSCQGYYTGGVYAYFKINYTDGIYSYAYLSNGTMSNYSLVSTAGKTISSIEFKNTYNSTGKSTIIKQGTLQLEEGSTATTYEPYTEQAQLISLGNIELAKIGDYTDRIFKAVQGNTIYDSLDSTTKASLTVGSWYVQGYKNKISYTGDGETLAITLMSGTTDIFILQSPTLINGKYKDKAFICNKFFYNSSHTVSSNNSASNQLAVNEMALRWTTNDRIYVRADLTLDQMKALSFDIWYVGEPTYTQITDTTLIGQLENILAMHTNKNVTNAWIEPSGTNATAGLTLTYKQDLQTLTDKISNLEARVSLLE